MEKHAKRARTLVAVGLLAAALFCAENAYSQNGGAQSFSRADAEKLEIVPADGAIFTNSEARFILRVPRVLPGDIQTELPDFPDGAAFSSSKKSDWISNQGVAGTEIDLRLTFKKAGTHSLPPLAVYIKGRRHSVKFRSVEVYENPRAILPRMILAFDDGQTADADSKKNKTITLESGKAARFTLYLQYAVQVQQFAWSVPEDSLFSETKRYDSAGRKASEFSAEKIPVADFEWLPFSAGRTSLPEIKIMAAAYSGRSVYVSPPDCAVLVEAAKKSGASGTPAESAAKALVYERSFDEDAPEDGGRVEGGLSPFDFARIAELRSLERRALFSAKKIRAERAAAEARAGVRNSENEPRYAVFALAAVLNASLLALALFFLLAKKRFEAAVSAAAAAALLFLTAAKADALFQKYGVIVAGQISPIPEESAMTKTEATRGSRVLIKEEITDWFYVAGNESGGWIKKENLAVIR